jgi:membrane-anchored protein YejM (alkaline phosphatase superfamily)
VSAPSSARHYLRPALLWALAHGPLVLFFYRRALERAADSLAPGMRLPLLAGYAIEGLALGLAGLVFTLPLLALGKRYAWAAPLLLALLAVFLYLDSLVFDALGMHVNGLVIEVALQPNGLGETGLPAGEIAGLAGTLAALVAAATWVGSVAIRRFATPKRALPIALVVLGLWGGERVLSGYQIFVGGQPAEAAVTLLPLQPRVRFNSFLSAVTGRKARRELNADLSPQVGTPASALDPAEVRFDRTPDIVLLLVESLRADFLTPEVMPHLTRRAAGGTVFLRHYSASASTQFSLFGLLYGIDAQRRDAVVGAGRTPLLFPALKRHGYETRFLAASSVEWMDLKETVFRDVTDGLETEYTGTGAEKDAAMVASARRTLDELPPDRPLFLFLFFAGTHYNYSYPERSAVFEPAWDGSGSFKASRLPPELLKNRAKNAAREVDAKIEEFLRDYEARRGRTPLLIVTGDHGEEFGERGVLGHASDVSVGQLHVPMIVFDEKLAPGTVDRVTSHVDVVPTILGLLGDRHDPREIGDGLPMFDAPERRYVLAMAGWKRRFALIGPELKAVFNGRDAGFGGVTVTDPDDRPLPDAEARFAREAPQLLRRLRGGSVPGDLAAGN